MFTKDFKLQEVWLEIPEHGGGFSLEPLKLWFTYKSETTKPRFQLPECAYTAWATFA